MKYPPHLNFSALNTPVIPLEKYFKEIKGYEIWMKRDDLTGLELSGNKVRKLDFLLAQARLEGAERIITCGGVQSNHCRTSAFYATQLGLRCTLVLKGSHPDRLEGNYFMNHLLNVDREFITHEEYQKVNAYMARLKDTYPHNSFVIPEGGSNEIGVWGYVRCFEELINQFKKMDKSLDAIIVATGSGGTHAGLFIGKLIYGSEIKVISVNVCDNADFFRRKIAGIIRAFNDRYGYHLTYDFDDIQIIDGFVGEGYGLIGQPEIEVIRRLARTEGIVIDPVYGAKAWRGFEQSLLQEGIDGKRIVFIHTGGIFGTFPYWKYF